MGFHNCADQSRVLTQHFGQERNLYIFRPHERYSRLVAVVFGSDEKVVPKLSAIVDEVVTSVGANDHFIQEIEIC
jgi:hypothetical protein